MIQSSSESQQKTSNDNVSELNPNVGTQENDSNTKSDSPNAARKNQIMDEIRLLISESVAHEHDSVDSTDASLFTENSLLISSSEEAAKDSPLKRAPSFHSVSVLKKGGSVFALQTDHVFQSFVVSSEQNLHSERQKLK
jgi:hypothetical protein